MRSTSFVRGLALVLLMLATARAAPAAPAEASIARLAWLQGCWAFSTAERQVEEQWMAPRAGSMAGMSRTTRGERLLAHEFVIVRERDGQLAYEVSPSGRPPTVFLSTEIGEASVVFENLANDFPQRVAYRRHGDELQAWIEGSRDGQPRRIEFPYRRAACAAPR